LPFIDADKGGYVDYLNKLLPLVKPGGLILAHNVDMVPDYVKAVTTSGELETIFYLEDGGLGGDSQKALRNSQRSPSPVLLTAKCPVNASARPG
jgi:hypothetical protein